MSNKRVLFYVILILGIYSLVRSSVLFEDDFETKDDWVVAAGTPGEDVTDGWYAIQNNNDSTAIIKHNQFFSTFTYTLKMRTDSLNDQGCGILFCIQNNLERYTFSIRANQQYLFGKWVDSGATLSCTVLSDHWSHHIAESDNLLKVSKSGADIYLFINDAFIEKITDSSFTQGSVGAGVGGGMTASFDYALVVDTAETTTAKSWFFDDFEDSSLAGWRELTGAGTVASENGVMHITADSQTIYYTSGSFHAMPCTTIVAYKSGNPDVFYGIVFLAIQPDENVAAYYYLINSNGYYTMFSDTLVPGEPDSIIHGTVDTLIVTGGCDFIVNGKVLDSTTFTDGLPFNGAGVCVYQGGVAVAFDDFRVGYYVEPPMPHVPLVLSFDGLAYGSAAWGDCNNDDVFDILLTGGVQGLFTFYEPHAWIYRYDTSHFVVVDGYIRDILGGCAIWGDYDNDNDLDIALSGFYRSPTSHDCGNTKIYRNDNGAFTDIYGDLRELFNSALAWGDYDNDGDPDLLLAGYDSTERVSILYENDLGSFSETDIPLPGVEGGDVAWGDYDNDGDLDLLLAGYDGTTRIAKIFKNEHDSLIDIAAPLTGIGGIFQLNYLTFPNGSFFDILVDYNHETGGSADWGDYDNDGDLDLLLCGFDGTAGLSKVYTNESGSFSDASVALHGIYRGTARWGDMNNDGWLDILLTGNTGTREHVSRVYISQSGSFSDSRCVLLRDFGESAADWGDYNGDGLLDIVTTGYYSNGFTVENHQTNVYRNPFTAENTPPVTPANLQSTVSGDSVVLAWDRSEDDHTPQNALTYNIRVGTQPNGTDIVSPMAALATGTRRIPAMGNTNLNSTWKIRNLLDGTYYWSVQAVDNAFRGSAFAVEDSFVISTGTDVSLDEKIPFNLPRKFALQANTPNPFRSRTLIGFAVPPDFTAGTGNNAAYQTRPVHIRIYDIKGRVVRTLLSGNVKVGFHKLLFDGRSDAGEIMGAGFYFCRMDAADYVKTIKMVKFE